MKIIDAMLEADLRAPNDIEQAQTLRWLSRLDGQLADGTFGTHVDTEVEFTGYDENTDMENTDLLVGPPYDGMYVDYLVMNIYLLQQEIQRYNNAALVYAESLRRWQNWYNKSHVPKTAGHLRF